MAIRVCTYYDDEIVHQVVQSLCNFANTTGFAPGPAGPQGPSRAGPTGPTGGTGPSSMTGLTGVFLGPSGTTGATGISGIALFMPPKNDPHIPGAVWLSGGTLVVSAG